MLGWFTMLAFAVLPVALFFLPIKKLLFRIGYTVYVSRTGHYFHRRAVAKSRALGAGGVHSNPTTYRNADDDSGVVVEVVPQLSDNYGYLIVDTKANVAVAVDVADAQAYVPILAKYKDAKLKAILSTHYHHDHAGGNQEMVTLHPGIRVFGGEHEAVACCTDRLRDNQTITDLGGLSITAIHSPAHTKGHVMYLVTCSLAGQAKQPWLFTGDCIFVGGCGRFFEGSAADMYETLHTKVKTLPPQTVLFPGHEYTVANLQFCQHVEPDNSAVSALLSESIARRGRKDPTVPSTIAQEQETNVFFRYSNTSVVDFARHHQQQHSGKGSTHSEGTVASVTAPQILSILREAKNTYKGPPTARL